ncbi:MAG: cation diffusion facilitator family transporter [Planctomycetota bacterium]
MVAALLGNTGVAASKLVAFFFTGSAAMLAEFYHSVADTVNQVFLLLGLRLQKRKPDERHPFGYTRESYFWAFVVAVSIFGLGAVLSIIEGASKIAHPHEIRNPAVTYLALGVAFVFETYALRVAWKEFQHWRVRNPGPLLTALLTAKAPTILVVIFEDSAALAGILVAAGGITLTLVTGNGVYDAVASLVIGGILVMAAGFIGMRARGLLLGEAATKADRARIREAVEGVSQVDSLVELLTMHLGPEDILINLGIDFVDDLTTNDVEAAIDEIERRIREAVPAAGRIFIEAESLTGRKERPASDDES